MKDIKDSIQASLETFAHGDCTAAELQDKLKSAGVQVVWKAEELEGLREAPSGTCAVSQRSFQRVTAGHG